VFCVLIRLDVGNAVASWSGFLIILLTRVAAIVYDIRLPKRLSSQ